ncbi:hypothetical protein R3I93_012187 [Phoxinus phoxinus]|uniref:Adhesion G-protein coupled receptor G2-like n=1 Tax=Phoxinus phoxinus TaxID=58324 RepID=A0AAN9H536_9TELE
MQNEVPSISDEITLKYLERLNVSSSALQMFLRNLEIQSGMKSNYCGLLLISALFCICAELTSLASAHNTNIHQPVSLINIFSKGLGKGKDGKGIFILSSNFSNVTGFTGYMEAGNCIKGNWNISDQSAPLFNSSASSETLCNITVFSSTKNSIENVVSLSGHSPYNLNISRSIMSTFVCLVEGTCKNYTWTKWIAGGCNWTLQDEVFFGDTMCNMTCLDPTRKCESVKYKASCRDDNGNDKSKMNTIEIVGKNAECFKCGSPFNNVPRAHLPDTELNKFNNTKTAIDAGEAAGVMKNLSSLLSFMENLTIASISMGSVEGVLQKIQSESDAKLSAFIYSAKTGIKVIDDISVLKDYPNALTIPKEASLQAFNKTAGNAFLGVFRFPNMTKDENNSTVLGNEVYAIEMGTQISNLTENISLAFRNTENMRGTPVCHSWDGSGNKPNWTTDGCTTVPDGNNITCNCNHLTFFAVLMVPPPVTISQNDLVTLTYITYIGCGLSMFFLVVGLFIHFLLRKAKATNSAHVLMNLFLALFLLNLAFLSNEYVARAKSPTACKVMAGFMHYSLLASFSWFAVEALHLCLQMSKHAIVIKHYILKISVVGWAPPAFVVSIIFIFGKYGEQTIQTDTSNVTMCWILDNTVHYVVNIGFYCFVFIFTSCTCIVVLRWLSMLKVRKFNKTAAVKRSGTASFDITTILGLCCLLGLTWSFTFFSYGSLTVPSYYIFTILNSFQGFFLFIYYMKTGSFFGDAVPSEDSNMTEDTNTENPYDNQTPTPAKGTI